MKIFKHKEHHGHEGVKFTKSENPFVYFPGIVRLKPYQGRCVSFVVKNLGLPR
jgi:hypothetical protein